MGAPDSKQFRNFIPKEQVGEAATWEFTSFTGEPATRGAASQLTERERRAFERGRAQGQAEGQAQERQVKMANAANLVPVIESMRARFGELHAEAGDALLDLAFTIARQVIRREVGLRRDALLPVLREAVTMIVDQHANPRVFLNPHDFALLQPELTADGLFKGCRFIPEGRIARGGCRVETAQGEIDATLASRWERVLASLGSTDGSREVEIPLAAAADPGADA